MGATSFLGVATEWEQPLSWGSRPNGSNLFLRGRDQMGATSFLGVATEWEQPLFMCGVYQVDAAQRAGVKKVLWTFDS